MWITWKIIVRETCFCEKIQADITVSWVYQKCFCFVPMLESRNVDPMKINCSWDMFFEEIQADYTFSWVFQKYFNFVPMLESRNADHMKSNRSDITVSSVFHNYFIFVPMLRITEYVSIKKYFLMPLFCEKVRRTSQFLENFKIV